MVQYALLNQVGTACDKYKNNTLISHYLLAFTTEEIFGNEAF